MPRLTLAGANSIYGQMAMRDEHMTALYSLVEQKGGLPQMNQTVFGYVLPP